MRTPGFLLLVLPALLAFKAEGPVDASDPASAPVLTNFMEGRVSVSNAEEVPGDLPRTVVQDEARIVSLTRGKACFEVTVRSIQNLETYYAGFEFKINREQVWPEGEPVTQVYDYAYTGSRTVLDLSAVAVEFAGGLRITEPVEGTVRIVERTWTVCGSPGIRKGRTDLHVLLKPRDLGDEALIERYRWHVR